MKNKLIVLSLSPLCLLTFIINFKFTFWDENTHVCLTARQFICQNLSTIIILLLCLTWIIISIYNYMYFKLMTSFDKNSGYTVKNIVEEKDAGLNFFLTLILPLLLGDLNQPQNAVAFLLIFIIIFLLLKKTDLFYQNPILSLLGYHIYEFEFDENASLKGRCIAVALSELNDKQSIEYKEISGNVLFVKAMKGRESDAS